MLRLCRYRSTPSNDEGPSGNISEIYESTTVGSILSAIKISRPVGHTDTNYFSSANANRKAYVRLHRNDLLGFIEAAGQHDIQTKPTKGSDKRNKKQFSCTNPPRPGLPRQLRLHLLQLLRPCNYHIHHNFKYESESNQSSMDCCDRPGQKSEISNSCADCVALLM